MIGPSLEPDLSAIDVVICSQAKNYSILITTYSRLGKLSPDDPTLPPVSCRTPRLNPHLCQPLAAKFCLQGSSHWCNFKLENRWQKEPRFNFRELGNCFWGFLVLPFKFSALYLWLRSLGCQPRGVFCIFYSSSKNGRTRKRRRESKLSAKMSKANFFKYFYLEVKTPGPAFE